MNNHTKPDQFSSNEISSAQATKKRSNTQARSNKHKKRKFNLLRINPLRKLTTLVLIVVLLILGIFGLDDTPFGDAVRSALDETTQPVSSVPAEKEIDSVLEVRIAENSIFLNDSEVPQEDLLGLLGQATDETVYLIDARAKQSTWESVESLLKDAGFIVVPIVE